LSTHALLSSRDWAEDRVRQQEEEFLSSDAEMIDAAIAEASRYGVNIVNSISDNIESYPVFNSLVNQFASEKADFFEDILRIVGFFLSPFVPEY